MDKLTQKVVRKIKQEKIVPKAKWKFRLKNGLIWLGFSVAILIGATYLFLITLIFSDLVLGRTNKILLGKGLFLMKAIPLSWIGLVLLLALVAFVDFRKTKRGYRLNWNKVVILVLGTYLLLSGGLLWLSRSSQYHWLCLMPSYRRIDLIKQEVWSHPEEGLLAGEIISLEENRNSGERNFRLKDFKGITWAVSLSAEANIRRVVIEPGETIKLLGKQVGDKEFEAKELRPWRRSNLTHHGRRYKRGEHRGECERESE